MRGERCGYLESHLQVQATAHMKFHRHGLGLGMAAMSSVAIRLTN